ncbi:MAG: [LysW]-lysine hydrolase [Trueperaceae bacterium]|nr:[LysW]-lysine hydrolase [Trueperaceae bacterium]
MVRLPSPSGAEAAVAEGFVAALAPHADEAFVDEVGNAVAVVGRGALRVTLLGHLDTFPGEPPVRLEDGVLHGRGAVDAKGPAAALAAALARAREDVREALELRFVGAVGEEAPGSRGARHAVLAYPRPHLLIVGEPSGWDGLTLGYKGHLRLRLRSERAAAHAARDEATACEALVAAWSRLRDWAATATPDAAGTRLFDRLQVALTSLASSHDGMAERAEAALGWRLPPAWPPDALRAALATLDLGPGSSWTADDGAPAVLARRDGRLARAFRAAIRGAGGVPAPRVKTGSSDWNVVASAWGADTVAYGPGDAALDHTPTERLALAEFDRSVTVLGDVLRRLAAGPDRPTR